MLPSVNLVYDTANDWVFRFGASKVIAWAPYNLMSNNLFLNDTMMTGSGGNPDLDPYKAYNFNLSAGAYRTVASWLRAGADTLGHIFAAHGG